MILNPTGISIQECNVVVADLSNFVHLVVMIMLPSFAAMQSNARRCIVGRSEVHTDQPFETNFNTKILVKFLWRTRRAGQA
jgi:hypothetical protein